jgi:5-methylcytosine-specific restriction endonuclease McrA
VIRLQKTTEPQILIRNAVEWTRVIVDKIALGQPLTQTEKTRYRHPEIKQALVEETHGKCAYCESKLLHIHHGDVEHIYPKSLAPERTVAWDNLTLACEICNQNKSDHDPNLEAIIDPYEVDPTEHLLFVGPLVFSRGTAPGTATRAILDLNRGELSERRREQLERIMSIYETLMRDDVPLSAKKAIYRNLKDREGSASAAYTAMTKALIERMKAEMPGELEAS